MKLAQQGAYTSATQSLVSSDIAKQTPSVVRDMKSKHPSPQHPSSFQSADDTPQITFTEHQVRNVVKSFRKGSAPGPDGL